MANVLKLAKRTAIVTLVTDGHRMYLSAVESAFGSEVDFAQLVKRLKPGPPDTDHRFSPTPLRRQAKTVITGNPTRRRSARRW